MLVTMAIITVGATMIDQYIELDGKVKEDILFECLKGLLLALLTIQFLPSFFKALEILATFIFV